MKLFNYEFGGDEKYGVFENTETAYEKRSEIDPMYEWTPVVITEVTVDGYEIHLTPIKSNVPIEDMDREQLKTFLKSKQVQFTPQWGDDKLREVALQNA